MPGKQRIDSAFDFSKLKPEAEQFVSMIRESAEVIKNFPKVVSIYNGAQSFSDFKKAHEEMIKADQQAKKSKDDLSLSIKEYEKLVNQSAQSQAKYNAGQSEAGKTVAATREQLRQQNLELKNQAVVQQAAAGSIEKMRAELSLLTSQYDKMSATERSSTAGQDLQQKIKGQVDALKQLEGETGRFQRNVGNYTGAINILEKSLQDVKQKIDDFTKAGKGNSDQVDKLKKEEDLLNQVLNKQAQGFSSLSMEIRANEKALGTMFEQGLSGSDAFKQLQAQTANAKRELAEFNEQQKLLSSQTPVLSAATLAAKGLAGAYAVGAGAAAIFGDENGKVSEKLQQLVAIMTVIQGLQEVHELLEKRGTIAKIASTVATQAQVLWQKILQATMFQSAAATVAFRIALVALTGGLLLLVPLIAFAGQKMSEVKSSAKDSAEAVKNLAEVTGKASEKYADAIVKVNELKTTLKLAKEGVIDKKKALEEFNETMGKVVGQAKSLNEAEDLIVKNADNYIRFTFLKAKAEAAAELAKESLKKSVETSAKGLEEFVSFGEKAKATVSSWQGILGLFSTPNVDGVIKTNQKMVEIGEKNKEEAIKTEQDKYNAFTKMQQGFFEEAAAFAKHHKLDFFEGKGGGDKKDENKQLEKDLKARFDLYRLEKERELEVLNQTIGDDKTAYNERLVAAMKFIDTKQKLIADSAAFEKSIGKKSADEKAAIDKQAYYDQIRAAEDTLKKVTDINDKIRESREKAASPIEIINKTPPDFSIYKSLMAQLDAFQKKQKEIADQDKQYSEERKERLKEFVAEVKETAYDLFVYPIEKEKNALQEQQDAKDKNYEKEVQNIQNSTLAEDQKAARLKVLEAEHLAQKEQTDRKVRELDEKKAKFDRAKSIVDIVQATATAIIKTLADFPGPQGLILSGIIGAIGAAQLARAIAQPIPKYFKGRSKSDPYEGPAIAGEIRPELLVRKDGSTEVIDKPSLIHVGKGDEIYPDVSKFTGPIMPFSEINGMILQSMMRNTVKMMQDPDGISKKFDQLRKENKEMLIWHAEQMKEAYKNSKQNIVINISDFKNSDYIKYSVRE
jgi:hypothetical protein